VTLRDHPEQLAVYYQPKIDLQTRRVVSAEALVRWNHATLGVLSPDRFIPLAETTGLIEQFTPVVLAAALAQCRRWRDDGHDISVAVNLSARNVGNPRLPERVAQALAHARVPASSLILEITESSIIADPVQTLHVLHALADLGVTISLDDFGTGYSSLSYLQRLPVREVKIDRSFVQGLTGDDPRPSRALIASIASLCASLGLRVVAEGVETASVLDELSDLGCDIGQGHHIARPVPHDAFSRWLAERAAANRGDDSALSLVVG
jgi:EAL domain-containing protein (putative c-di-GMP-specific phosphodiesterase class I)